MVGQKPLGLPPTANRNQSTITAFHEAGHAVMAMACGFVVKEMSIEPTESGLGHVAWASREEKTTQIRKLTVLVLVAGMAADFIHWREVGVDPAEELTGDREDQKKAAEELIAIDQAGAFECYLVAAIRFLEKEDVWTVIKSLAGTMLLAGTVNGRAVLDRAAEICPKISDVDIEFLDTVVEAKIART